MKTKRKLIIVLIAISGILFSGCNNNASSSSETPSSSRSEYLDSESSSSISTLPPQEDTLPAPDENTVLYYKFNEGSGGNIHDETNLHPGKVVNFNRDNWTKGKYGNALSFNSSINQYVYVDDAPDLTPVEITFEMIVKFDAASRYITFQRLFFKDWAYNLFLDNSGTPTLKFNLYTETNQAWETAKISLNGEVFDGKYHHLAFTYNGVSGLARGYFDYYCEQSIYLSPGVIMPQVANYPLYIGSGFWAQDVQQSSTCTIDTFKISNKDLFAFDYLGSDTDIDNYLESISHEKSKGTTIYDIDLLNNKEGKVIDQNKNVIGGLTKGSPQYTDDGIYLEQERNEMSFEVDDSKFVSGDLGVEVLVKLDEKHEPDPYSQLDGVAIYKANDFMICTYVYPNGGNNKGYIVTFRVNMDKTAGLISVENQMCVNYNIYDGKIHHLALNYNSETATMDGYIDYKKVVSKTFSGISETKFEMDENTDVLLGRSINNWQCDGWYNHVIMRDGTTASQDMYNYQAGGGKEYKETGDLVCDVRFNERVTSRFSTDYSEHNNNVFFLDNTSLIKEDNVEALNIEKENVNAAYIKNSSSINSKSLTVEIDLKLNFENSSDGLHRVVFKDFQFDICLEIKANGIGVSSKINTHKDGWLTRVKGNANVFKDGGYHTITMAFNSSNGTARLLVDGKVVGKTVWGGDIIASSTDCYLGSGYWNNLLQQGTSCLIKGLKIFNFSNYWEE